MDEREFETLPFEEQQKIFHESPLKERGILLTHSQDPRRLVQSLTKEELYLLTREVDYDERGAIIRYASLGQLFFISDVDCWKRDQIDPAAFLSWLESLLAASEEKLTSWLTSMDYEAIIAGLKKIIYVLKPEREYATDETLGDVPYFTLDEYYYIYVREENLETVKRVFQIIYERYRGKYAALLEGVIGDMTDELEEEAFRRRGIRLAERGFPEADSAQAIYKPISQEEFESFPKKTKPAEMEVVDDDQAKAPSYPVLWADKKCFFDEVIWRLRDQQEPAEVLDGLQEEIAWLANKVIACAGLDFSSEDKVREGAGRARYQVSIGLELLSGGDLDQAKVIAKERWLELIFRWANTQLHQLRTDAQALVREYWQGKQLPFFQFLDAPYDVMMQGLLQNRPRFYDFDLEENIQLRDFHNVEELKRAGQALAQVDAILAWIRAKNPNLMSVLVVEENASACPLFSYLGNSLALHALEIGEWRALSEEEVKTFSQKYFRDEKNGKKVDETLKASFFDGNFSQEEQALLRPLLALFVQRLEEEVAQLVAEDFSNLSDVKLFCLSFPNEEKES